MIPSDSSDPATRMSDFRPGPPAGPREPMGLNTTIPAGRIFRAIRRHLTLVLFVAGAAAGGVLAALQGPAQYRASAMMRLAGERRQTSAGVEDAAPPVDRSITPILSLVPRIRSRTIIGTVVDSLNLQLRWVPQVS